MTSWLEGCRIVIRLQLRRGDYVPVCPAGLQYLAFPSLGVHPPPPSSQALPLPPFSVTPALLPSPQPVHLCDHSLRPRRPPPRPRSHSCPRRRRHGFLSKEEGRKFEMTVGDGGRGSVVERPRWRFGAREVRGGKNCIHSNDIRERHRVLRNQLNGEKLAVEGDSWAEGWKGLKVERKRGKERGKAVGTGGLPSRLLCQVDEAGRDEKTDGERRNLQ